MGTVAEMALREKGDEWIVENEEVVLHTRVGDMLSARVQNGRTGKRAEFYCLDFADWVNIVAVTPDNNLVLIKQYRFGTRKVELEIPGGAIEKGENPLEAGLRELLEETGFAGQNGRIIGSVYPNPAIQKNRCYTVLVEQAEEVSEQSMDEMEDIEVLTLPFEEVDLALANGELSHGLVLNALMFYLREKEKGLKG